MSTWRQNDKHLSHATAKQLYQSNKPKTAFVTYCVPKDDAFIICCCTLGLRLKQEGCTKERVLMLPYQCFNEKGALLDVYTVFKVFYDKCIPVNHMEGYPYYYCKIHALSLTDYARVMFLEPHCITNDGNLEVYFDEFEDIPCAPANDNYGQYYQMMMVEPNNRKFNALYNACYGKKKLREESINELVSNTYKWHNIRNETDTDRFLLHVRQADLGGKDYSFVIAYFADANPWEICAEYGMDKACECTAIRIWMQTAWNLVKNVPKIATLVNPAILKVIDPEFVGDVSESKEDKGIEFRQIIGLLSDIQSKMVSMSVSLSKVEATQRETVSQLKAMNHTRIVMIDDLAKANTKINSLQKQLQNKPKNLSRANKRKAKKTKAPKSQPNKATKPESSPHKKQPTNPPIIANTINAKCSHNCNDMSESNSIKAMESESSPHKKQATKPPISIVSEKTENTLENTVNNIMGIDEQKNKGTNELELEGIKIVIVEDENHCDQIMSDLLSQLQNGASIVGIDCEWKSFKRVCEACHKKYDNDSSQVSLLQIAHSSVIALIRIHLFKSIPESLTSFLSNAKVIKAGVGIFLDMKKLKRCYNLNVCGCVDINRHFVQIIAMKKRQKLFDIARVPFNERGHISLALLCESVLGKTMVYKQMNFGRNWEKKKLSQKQMFYAADDALVGFQLFLKIEQMRNLSLIEIEQIAIANWAELQIFRQKQAREAVLSEEKQKQKTANKKQKCNKTKSKTHECKKILELNTKNNILDKLRQVKRAIQTKKTATDNAIQQLMEFDNIARYVQQTEIEKIRQCNISVQKLKEIQLSMVESVIKRAESVKPSCFQMALDKLDSLITVFGGKQLYCTHCMIFKYEKCFKKTERNKEDRKCGLCLKKSKKKRKAKKKRRN